MDLHKKVIMIASVIGMINYAGIKGRIDPFSWMAENLINQLLK